MRPCSMPARLGGGRPAASLGRPGRRRRRVRHHGLAARPGRGRSAGAARRPALGAAAAVGARECDDRGAASADGAALRLQRAQHDRLARAYRAGPGAKPRACERAPPADGRLRGGREAAVVPVRHRRAARGARLVRVVIVDDEAPARSELRHLLGAHAGVEVVGEAASAAEAAEFAGDCDAVFLDIELAGASGLDAARLLRGDAAPPAVVFVTAHAEYAVQAFAVEAFDYLLKPVDPERLARVVARLAERPVSAREPRKIPVVAGGRTELIDQEQVHYVQAEGDYSRVHTYDRS